MYCINDKQIDFILNDIRRRGIEMEDLQSNLLDHICCIIEQNLKEGDDFEEFYKKTIPQFFENELWEIEQETITLLTFKNYYAMKKTMIISGIFSVTAFVAGSFFKIMHWPGASPLLILGIAAISFIFLPLMFVLKAKEASAAREKLVAGVGTLIGILLCMSTLFRLMHWPGASILWISTSACSIFLFIPIYFFSGLRKPETKTNTVVTTIILIGATGLLFSLTSIRKSRQNIFLETKTYYKNEQLLARMRSKVSSSTNTQLCNNIQNACDKIKGLILKEETGYDKLPPDFDTKNILITEGGIGDSFGGENEGSKLLNDLKELLNNYNTGKNTEGKVPVDYPFFELSSEGIMQFSNLSLLNSLTQIQLFVAGSELQLTPVK